MKRNAVIGFLRIRQPYGLPTVVPRPVERFTGKAMVRAGRLVLSAARVGRVRMPSKGLVHEKDLILHGN